MEKTKNVLFDYSEKTIAETKGFPQHSHAVCELIFIKKGKVTYTVRGIEYRLKKNDLIITRPSEIHGIIAEKETVYERYDILFNEKTMPFDIFKKIPAKTDIINVEHNHIIMNLFEKMDYYKNCLKGSQLNLILTNLCQELLINIVMETSSKNKQPDYTVSNEIVSNAMAYIDEHLLDITGVEDIASALFVTKSHLHHLFIEHLMISPKKYIMSKKMVLAQREILSGKNPTKIYEKYGFNDYSAFYRAYKNHFKVPPSEKSISKMISGDNNIL